MSSIEILRAEYPGDGAWGSYASYYASLVDASVPSDRVEAIVPADPMLARTLVGVFGIDRAIEWVDQPNDALDGLSPREVIATVDQGVLVVRHAVMRIPV